MDEPQKDRRRIPSGLDTRPRPSPANVLILVVVGVLAVTAAAAAFFGTGLEETTPHGQVLTALQHVAEAQEAHHRETGTFAQWTHTLAIEPHADIRVELVRGDRNEWEALAIHPIGLSCIQAGKVDRDRPRREQPVCWTNGGD